MHSLTRQLAFILLIMAMLATAVAAERAQGSFERTLSVSGPVQLHVSTGSGTLQVRGGDGNQVRIRAQVTAHDRWGAGDPVARVREVEQNPPIRQTGNVITIGNEVRKWQNVGISYDITVPSGTSGSLSTGSGNIDASDMRGPFKLDTGSGSIHAEDIGNSVDASTGSGNITVGRTEGGVRARTGSGSIEAGGVGGSVEASTGSGNVTVSGAAGSVRANAGSGRIRIERAQADVEAHSSSGGVTVDGAPKSARWDLRSGSGSVVVSLPPGTPFELDAHTGSGQVSTSHPVTVSGTLRRNEMRGVAIRAENRLILRTGSGNIKVD